MAASLKDRLNSILIDNKIITAEQLQKALDVQKERGGKLSQILIDLGYINEKDLMVALSQEMDIPPINLLKYKIDAEVVKIVPKEIARHYQIIPISKIGNTLTVVMADPLNVFAIDDIKTLTGYQIRPVLATSEDILATITQYYGEVTHQAIEEIVKDLGKAETDIITEAGIEEVTDAQELLKLTQETPVVRLTNMILAEATRLKASDILIEPMEDTLRIRYRIDGVLREVQAPPKTMHSAIVSRIKVMSELNIAERRLPQDGRFKAKLQDREVDFRVSVLPSSFGEKVALRILDKSQAMLDVSKLGFEGQALEDLKKCSGRPHGMLLICGPTGSGKTTTLYSILKHIDSPERNIITVEDPVEYKLEGINQVTSRPDIKLTFANALRSILRQDPDIIMIGEIRDFETVDIAIKAALTGHLVLSTLHTNTAAGSITRLVNMGVEPFLITSSVILVAAQRLVRKICPKCKESYEVGEALKKELGIKKAGSLTFFKGKGCKNCFNTGYSGRIGLIEVLVLDQRIRNLILEKANEHVINETARQAGMVTLREDGINKVQAGLTSLEEVLRVTIGSQG